MKHLFAYEYALRHLRADDALLELGAGTAYGTRLFAQKVRGVAVMDVDRATASEAAADLKAANCMFGVYDGRRLPFSDGTFDAAAAFQVVEHVPDDGAWLAEVRRVLKTGGLFLLTTPNRAYRLARGQKPWNPEHVREYAPEEFLRTLSAVFPLARVEGIRGKREVQDMEKRRCRPARLRGEPSHKRLLARGADALRHTLGFLRETFHGGSPEGGAAPPLDRRYSTADFYVIEKGLKRGSLDLLGLCRK